MHQSKRKGHEGPRKGRYVNATLRSFASVMATFAFQFISFNLYMAGSSPPLINQRRHQSRPTGLMRSAQAGACVALEIFVEQN